LAAHSIISSALGKQRRRNFKAEHKVAIPVNWKHGEDVIIAGSVTDEDAPSNEAFIPPSVRPQNTSGLPEGRPLVFRNYWSIAVDNNRTTVAVSVSVVITVLPNNNRFVTISPVPIPKVFTIAITVTMTFTHGHSMRTYADSDFFRSSRNCAANPHHGGYCYCVLDHCVLL
jgi:hypothetical protein